MKYYILAQFLRKLNHEDNKCLETESMCFFALNVSANIIQRIHKDQNIILYQWRTTSTKFLGEANLLT